MRLSDKVLFAGNGGEKKSATYDEDEELNCYVMDLQKFDKVIKSEIKKGSLTIEGFDINIQEIDNKTFYI